MPALQTDGLDPRNGETHMVRLRELGELLRRSREEQNITVAQAVEATKVRARYLLAIEAGDLTILPGKVYARGFVRAYADYLGLRGQELANLYLGIPRDEELPRETQGAVKKKVQEPSYVEVKEVTPARSRARQKQLQRAAPRKDASFGRGLLRLAGGVVVFTLLVVLYALISHHGSTNSGSAVTGTIGQPTVVGASRSKVAGTSGGHTRSNSASAVAGHKGAPGAHKPGAGKALGGKVTPTLAVIKEVGATSTSEQFSVTAPGPLQVTFSTPGGRCWFETTADGQILATTTLPQGQTLKWSAQQTLSLDVGNMPAIRVLVDGTPVHLARATGGFTYTFTRQPTSSR